MSRAGARAFSRGTSPEASGWGREVSGPVAGAQRDRDLGTGSVRATAAQDPSPAQPAARWLLHGMGPCCTATSSPELLLHRSGQGAPAVPCTPCPQLPGVCGRSWRCHGFAKALAGGLWPSPVPSAATTPCCVRLLWAGDVGDGSPQSPLAAGGARGTLEPSFGTPPFFFFLFT